MANRFIVSTLTASAVAAAYFLGKDENREKVAKYVNSEKLGEYVNKENLGKYVNKEKISQYVNRAKAEIRGETKEDENEHLREKVGHSDPEDLQDNRMVDEGAQFSVNYYNENLKDEEDKEK